MSEDYIALKASISLLRGKLNKLVKKETELRNEIIELLKSCSHEEIEPKQEYDSGDYYNRANTKYYNQCTLCGTPSAITTKTHSYYG